MVTKYRWKRQAKYRRKRQALIDANVIEGIPVATVSPLNQNSPDERRWTITSRSGLPSEYKAAGSDTAQAAL